MDGDLDGGQNPRLEVRFDQRTADAEIRKPAFPDREPMGHYSDREINLHALAPPMFHTNNDFIRGYIAPSDKHRNGLRQFLHELSGAGDSASALAIPSIDSTAGCTTVGHTHAACGDQGLYVFAGSVRTD